MAIIPIDSVDDPRIAVFRDRKSAFAKRRQFLFVAEGLTLTERLLASGLRIASAPADGRHVERLHGQMRESAPLSAAEHPERTAMLLGSEGFGLEPQWVELCDHRVTIPMSRGVDSLNVSVAAGICLHYSTMPNP